MKKIIKLLLLSITTFFGCNNHQSKIAHQSTSDEYVIIVETKKTGDSIYIKHPFSYQNFTAFETVIKDGDTLRIKCATKKKLVVGNKNNFLETLILSKGDTLMLSTKENGEMMKSIRNKGVKEVERWSLYEIMENHPAIKNYDSLKSLVSVKAKNPMVIVSENYKIKDYPFHFNLKDIDDTHKYVGSLINAFSILLQEYEKRLDTRITDRENRIFYLNYFKDTMFDDFLLLYEHTHDKRLKNLLLSETFTSDSFLSDSNFNYGNLRRLLHRVAFNLPRNPTVSQLTKLYNDAHIYFKSERLKEAKMICLIDMLRKGNEPEIIHKYLNDFVQTYKDSTFIEYANQKYMLSLKEVYHSDRSIHFIDSDEVISGLDDLLQNKLKNKVVYVDLWASWCAPCRKAMPASIKLKKELEAKDIAFVYFSTDHDAEKWKEASKKEGIGSYKYNYLFLNYSQSQFKKDLNIKTIPRYLIYDKHGVLVYHDAPGPENIDVKEILTRLAK